MGSQVERTHGKAWAGTPGEAVAGRAGNPTFDCRQTRRNNRRARQTKQPRVPAWGNKASKPLTKKTCGGCSGRRNSQPHRRVHWRDHRVLECTQAHPPWNKHQKGPICLWVAGEVTESQLRAKQAPHFSLSDPSPTTQQCELPHPGEYLRLCPLQVTGTLRQKIWPK